MISTLILALLLIPTVALGQTGQPQVTFGTPAATSVPMTITWTPAPGATTHVVDGGYNDDTGYFNVGSVGSPVSRPMLYHTSGAAAPGWVCVKATVNGASLEVACNGFTAPAKPTGPPTSSLRTATYKEPVMTNLASIRLYYTLNGVAQPTVTFPVSGPTGGATRTQTFTVAADQGTIVAYTTAVTTAGSESGPSNTSTLVFQKPVPIAPSPGTVGVITIIQ